MMKINIKRTIIIISILIVLYGILRILSLILAKPGCVGFDIM